MLCRHQVCAVSLSSMKPTKDMFSSLDKHDVVQKGTLSPIWGKAALTDSRKITTQ